MSFEGDRGALDAEARRLLLVDRMRQADRRATSSRVASVLAHLIGTPLNVITGRAALIRANPTAETAVENCRRIEEQVERLSVSVRRLIDYLTIPEPEYEPLTVEQIVLDAVALCAPVAAARGVTLAAAPDEPPRLAVEGVPALVVLTSLLSLAVRVAKPGDAIRLSVASVGSDAAFDVTLPGFDPPPGRIDRLEPPDHGDAAAADALQVLSFCFAIAGRHGGALTLVRGEPHATVRLVSATVNAGA